MADMKKDEIAEDQELMGEDEGLEAVRNFEAKEVDALIADQLRLGNIFNAVHISYVDALTSAPKDRLVADDYLRLTHALAEESNLRAATYMANIGSLVFPNDDSLKLRFEALRSELSSGN